MALFLNSTVRPGHLGTAFLLKAGLSCPRRAKGLRPASLGIFEPPRRPFEMMVRPRSQVVGTAVLNEEAKYSKNQLGTLLYGFGAKISGSVSPPSVKVPWNRPLVMLAV